MGPTGSGKTTYAQQVLEPAGAVRLSVDEEVFARHGRYGIDYPEDGYFERVAPVVAELHQQLAELVAEGRDVVGPRTMAMPGPRGGERARRGGRRAVEAVVGSEELLRRLTERNGRLPAG
ncbi:AAA family ATPase [Streptomyces sp. NPDC048272]|uniref:AAA family ATPase n=1 Tax=Streptomyces sp. NPDC048272 TaxID=3154616 RepID=UPI00344994B4